MILTPWAKEHIVDAVSALNWRWFNVSLNHLSLALCDNDEISPQCVYKDEVTKLNAQEMIKLIKSFKRIFLK